MRNDIVLTPVFEVVSDAVTLVLKKQHLEGYVKKIWAFKGQCLVVDLSYKRVWFGFNITPSNELLFSVDLVRRKGGDTRHSVTIDGVQKENVVAEVNLPQALIELNTKITEVIARIDAYKGAAQTEIDPEGVYGNLNLSEDPKYPPRKSGRVGVMTLPLSGNIGGNLQAFALMAVLKNLDYSPILLNRRYPPMGAGRRAAIRAAATMPLIADSIAIEDRPENQRFIDENISPISKVFYSSKQLKESVQYYDLDAVVVGSDQVWRPKYARSILSDFFHGFIDADHHRIKRVSYAASFGADSWEYSDEQTQKVAALIRHFDAVSVREDSAANMCREFLGAEAKHVLDPTLLLSPDEYLRLVSNRSKTSPCGGVVTYVLDPNADKERVIETLSQRLGLSTYSTSGEVFAGGASNKVQPIDKSVEGWLASLHRADFVVTDSFHGLVFSILFNKPFVAYGNPNRGMARFSSILRMFGLEERLVVDASKADVDKLLEPINWSRVNDRLNELRAQSLEFLKSSLGSPDIDAEQVNRDGLVDKQTRAGRAGQIALPLNVMCTGCGVCVSESQGSLRMGWSDDGFLVPQANGRAIPTDVVRVCPFNPTPEKAVQDEDALGRLYFPDAAHSHPRGGRYSGAYIGYSKEFRPTSSSGGMATYVFKSLLDRKAVDYLFVVQGDGESGYKYRVFTGDDDIHAISKTRYYPVTLEELFDVIEKTEGRVGVSGVACFVKAIRLKQHYHPALKEKITFLIGIICGGLKSKGYTDFLAQSAGIPGVYTSAQYRVKQPDGEANDYFFSAVDNTSQTHQVRMRRLGDMWGSGLFKSKACDFCTDVLTELADISLGDAWIPEYNKDGMGNSVIVTRNQLADEIIRSGISNGELSAKEAPIELIVRSQSGGLNHKQNALKFRLLMAREFTDIPMPSVRTRVEKDSTPAEMLVQLHRDRVRSKSLAYWAVTKNIASFNKRMRSSRQALKEITLARKENSAGIGECLIAAISKLNPDRPVTNAVSDPVQIAVRWLKRKVHLGEISSEALLTLLNGAEGTRLTDRT